MSDFERLAKGVEEMKKFAKENPGYVLEEELKPEMLIVWKGSIGPISENNEKRLQRWRDENSKMGNDFEKITEGIFRK